MRRNIACPAQDQLGLEPDFDLKGQFVATNCPTFFQLSGRMGSRTHISPLSSSALARRRGSRKIGEPACKGHSLLASTQKLDRPTAMTSCVRWSNTTYSPGDSSISSSMRIFADSRSSAASNQQKLPSGFFFRMLNGECMDASCVVTQTEGGTEGGKM